MTPDLKALLILRADLRRHLALLPADGSENSETIWRADRIRELLVQEARADRALYARLVVSARGDRVLLKSLDEIRTSKRHTMAWMREICARLRAADAHAPDVSELQRGCNLALRRLELEEQVAIQEYQARFPDDCAPHITS
jgi:hypothetical protein